MQEKDIGINKIEYDYRKNMYVLEKNRDYKTEIHIGIFLLFSFMIIHLFVRDFLINGKFPSGWLGVLIGSSVAYFIRNMDQKEQLIIPILMIGNYFIFRYYYIYIPNYIVFFISFSLIIVYYIQKEGSKYINYKILGITICLVAFFFLDYYMFSDNLLKDRNFDRLIKNENNIKEEISKEDLLGIEKLSIDDDYYINNIEGIEYFKNLKSLFIWDASMIKDLSPLVKLSNLEFLMIDDVDVDKLESINKIESLRSLEIVYPQEGKIDALNNFPNLNTLFIQGMDFEDLKGLKGPKYIEKLHLGAGLVISFEGISNFPYLKELSFYKLHIKDISQVFNLKELETIKFNDCEMVNMDEFIKTAREKGVKIEVRKLHNKLF